jgi:hypothetical protein
MEEFNASGAYEVVNDGSEEIASRHKDFLDLRKLAQTGDPSFGYLYISPKFHKPDIAHRAIAALHSCTTTECATMLVAALSLILKTLNTKCDAYLDETGFRRFFVVNGYEEVASAIHLYRRTRDSEPNLWTGDFSTMYTSIEHGDLLMRLRECYEEAWEYQASVMGTEVGQLYLRVTQTGAKTHSAVLGSD